MKERFATDTLNRPDPDLDNGLRPRNIGEFVGQQRTCERLDVFVKAASERGESLDHCLFCGPPGLGKTTLAHLMAHAMGVHIRVTSGPVINRPGDLAGLLTSMDAGDMLFIDEIHRMPKAVEEYLYAAMEDFVIDIMIDQGANARSVRLNLPRFTLIGATTRSGLLSAALRSRFGMTNRLNYYPAAELQRIVLRSAGILKIAIDDEGAAEIAARSRGTPRIANNLVRRVRDFAQVRANNHITRQVADDALNMLDIDAFGLDEMDKRILRVIAEKFSGGPVGLSSMAVSVGEEADTLEEVYEPYLIQEGYLKRTPQGRVITALGCRRLGLPCAADHEPQGRLL